MRHKIIWLLFVLVIISQHSIATNISTSMLYASTQTICGRYSSNSTIIAINVKNELNITLINVVAELVTPSALPILYDKRFSIGNLEAHQTSPVLPAWQITCNESMPGSYSLYVKYFTDNNISDSSADDAAVNIAIDAPPPNIISSSPSGLLTSSQVTISATTDKNSICKMSQYDLDYSFMETQLNGQEINHYTTLNLNNGNYHYYVRCSAGSKMISSHVIEFSIDTIPLVINSAFPTGLLVYESVDINVTTNKDSICKFDTQNRDYDLMSSNFNNLQTRHYLTLSLSDGSYTYYIGCRDSSGKKTYTTLGFIVSIAPTAEIKFESEPPLKAGIYKVYVVTSKDVEYLPNLEFTIEKTGERKRVPLQGSGKNWNGYIIIESVEMETIGTFSFSAVDINGISGNQITDGKLFIIDAIKPPAPDTITAGQQNNSIQLQWHYDGEHASFFNIYRKKAPYVNYADFFSTSDALKFQDKDIKMGVIYYYKVSAVDKAGNEGPLSPEASIEFKTELPESQPVFPQPDNFNSLELLLSKIGKLQIDLDSSLMQFRRASEKNSQIIKLIGLDKNLEQSKKELDAQNEELLNIKSKNLTGSELDNSLSTNDLRLKKILIISPKDIVIEQISESMIMPLSSDIEKSVEYLNIEGINTEAFKDFYKKYENGINITRKFYSLIITYHDKSEKKYLLVIKAISGERNVTGQNNSMISIVESIPKSVAGSTDKILLLSENKIVKSDPIIKFTLAGDVKYLIEDADIEDGKSITSLIVPNVFNITNNTSVLNVNNHSNSLTGMLFTSSDDSSQRTEKTIIFFGFFIIIALITYYFFIKNNKKKKIDKDQILKNEIAQIESLTYSLSDKYKKESEKRSYQEKYINEKWDETAQEIRDMPSELNSEINNKVNDSIKQIERGGEENQHLKKPVKDLIDQAYEAVKLNNYEQGRAVYVKIIVIFAKLDKEGQKKFREEIIQLTYILNLSYIKSLLLKAHKLHDQGQYKNSYKIYGQIRHVYKKLPKRLKARIFDMSMKLYKELNGVKA